MDQPPVKHPIEAAVGAVAAVLSAIINGLGNLGDLVGLILSAALGATVAYFVRLALDRIVGHFKNSKPKS
jgi:hypothetical protein